jgi:hypothetical protein
MAMSGLPIRFVDHNTKFPVIEVEIGKLKQ